MSDNQEFQELLEYDSTNPSLSVRKWPNQETPGIDETSETVVEALSLLDGWCQPLAVAISYRLRQRRTGDREKPRASILFAPDLPAHGASHVRTWPMWADPRFPDTITPDVISADVHQRLEASEGDEEAVTLEALQFFSNRYRVFPPHDTTPELLITLQGSGSQVPVPTELIGDQLWVFDQPAHSSLFQIADISMHRSDSMGSFDVEISLSWSNHGAEGSPGWAHLLGNANRLVTDQGWELQSAQPHKNPT